MLSCHDMRNKEESSTSAYNISCPNIILSGTSSWANEEVQWFTVLQLLISYDKHVKVIYCTSKDVLTDSTFQYTVKPVWKDYHWYQEKVVFPNSWSFEKGSLCIDSNGNWQKDGQTVSRVLNGLSRQVSLYFHEFWWFLTHFNLLPSMFYLFMVINVTFEIKVCCIKSFRFSELLTAENVVMKSRYFHETGGPGLYMASCRSPIASKIT